MESDQRPAPDALAAWQAGVRACERLGMRTHDAQDCASDALLAALLATRRGDEIDDLTAWVSLVAKRRAVDEMRRQVRSSRRMATLAGQRQATENDPADAVADADEARWLMAQVERLPLVTRRVVETMATDALTARAAAAQLGITSRAAESHLLRARQRLKAKWTATAALVWPLLMRVRRAAGHAAVRGSAALSAACMVTAIFSVGFAHRGLSGGEARAHLLTTRPAVPVHDQGGAASVSGPIVRPPGRSASRTGRHSSHYAVPTSIAPIASAHSPAATVTVTQEPRPWGPGPVAAIEGCLQNLSVSTTEVGC